MPVVLDRPTTSRPIVPTSAPFAGLDDITENAKGPWVVVLYNDETHSIDEVILQIQHATGCSEEKAERLTLRVHEEGRAIILEGKEQECRKAAEIISQIGLQVECYQV